MGPSKAWYYGPILAESLFIMIRAGSAYAPPDVSETVSFSMLILGSMATFDTYMSKDMPEGSLR